jgi:hypothetical protein
VSAVLIVGLYLSLLSVYALCFYLYRNNLLN